MRTRYYLTLSTWAGTVPHAVHYYGRIRWFNGTETKEHDVGTSNGKDGKYGNTRYLKKEYVLKAARRWFRDVAINGSILTLGSSSVIDPQKVLEGESEFARQANYIWRRFEILNGWEAPKDRWPQVQVLCDEWTKIVENHLHPKKE